MSYSGRKRYTTRREKNELMAKRMKGVLIIAFLALIVYCVKNRVALWDYIQTYFY